MIDRETYSIDHIGALQRQYDTDPGLIERALYAFGLLEAIKRVGMPFCFKGGTSLMLITDRPARLSTDIDIIVSPGTDVDGYIEKASKIFPFLDKKEDIRRGKNGIVKRHFRFFYYSPIRKTRFYILLDIVFATLPFAKTMEKEINNELLMTSGSNLGVEMPTADCLLGDKLTAFAPHTIGVALGSGKELEIAKQLFDVATLSECMTDYELVAETYAVAAKEEAAFRGGNWSQDDALRDTIRACISIVSRGATDGEDYVEYLRGMKSLKNHVLIKGYNANDATWKACVVMHLASCLLSGNAYKRPENPEGYLSARLEGDAYKRLAYVRKQNPFAYACLVEATRNLNETR